MRKNKKESFYKTKRYFRMVDKEESEEIELAYESLGYINYRMSGGDEDPITENQYRIAAEYALSRVLVYNNMNKILQFKKDDCISWKIHNAKDGTEYTTFTIKSELIK